MATPSASTDVLDITDLDKVFTVLEKSKFPDNQWDDLGLKLGITKPKLDTIREDKQDSNDRLKECLSCWLYQNYDIEQYGKPTVESLAAALRGMGLNAVASKVPLNLTKAPAQHVAGVHDDEKGVEIHVPNKSRSNEFSSIRLSFGRMISSVFRAIEESLHLDDLKRFLYVCRSDLKAKLDNCDSMQSVVGLIRDECSLTDITLLEAVVEEFKVTKAKEYIEEYKRSLKEFCESLSVSLRLKEKLEAVETSPLKNETVTYVFDWRPDKKELCDIVDILAKISGKPVEIKCIDTGY